MNKYKCPDCGKTWEQTAPQSCPECGCPSTNFIVSQTVDYYSPTTTGRTALAPSPLLEESNNYAAEKFTMIIAKITLFIYGFFAASAWFVGLYMALKIGHEIGFFIFLGSVLGAALLFFIGYVIHVILKIVANISYRLTRIDMNTHPNTL